MAVDAFKDELRSDVGVWQSMNYLHVDSIIEIHKYFKPFDLDQQEFDMKWCEHISQDRWPSVRLSYQAIVAHIQKIWDTFLSAKVVIYPFNTLILVIARHRKYESSLHPLTHLVNTLISHLVVLLSLPWLLITTMVCLCNTNDMIHSFIHSSYRHHYKSVPMPLSWVT